MVFCMKKWQFFGADGTLNFDTKVDVTGVEKGTKQASSAFTSGMAGAAKAAASDIGTIFANGLSVFLGNAMTAASGQLTNTIKGAISAGESFEAEMSRVGAISGTTGADFDRLQEKAKEMGRTTAFSATEAAEAFEYMAMAGWKTDDMLNSIEGVMNLAAASGESLGTVSDIVTDAMTAFGLAADGMTDGVSNATHFADVLAAASSNANTNVGMMGETFKYVAPLAGSLGFSVEDTAAAIGLMANAGIKGSQAGTALRSLFTRLTKPTKEVQGAMDALGLSITNSDGSMKSLEQITGDLRQAFSGLGEAEKAQVAAALAGQEAMSGLLAIVNASDADYGKLTSAINGANGAAAGMADTMLDNVGGAKKIFASAMEGFNLAVYDYLQGPLKSFYQWGSEAVSRLTKGLQGGGLSGLFKAAEGIFSEITKRLTSKIPVIANAAKKMALSIFNGIKDVLPKIVKMVAGIIPKIISAIQKALPGIVRTLGNVIKTVVAKVKESIPKIVDAVKKAIPKIKAAVEKAVPKIIDAAKSAFSKTQDIAEDLAPKVIDGAKKLFDKLKKYVEEHGPDIIEAIGKSFTGKVEFLGKIATAIGKALPDILAAAGKVFQGVVAYIKDHKEEIMAAIGQVIEGLAGIGGTLFENLSGALGYVIGELKKWWEEHGEEIKQKISDFVSGLWEKIKEKGPELLEKLMDVFWDVVGLIEQNGEGIISTVGGVIAKLIEDLPQMFNDAVNAFGDFIDRAADEMDRRGESLTKAAEEAVGKITDAVGKSSPHIIEKGGELIEKLSEGLSGGLPKISDAVLRIVSEFIHKLATHMPDIIEAGLRLVGHLGAGIIKAIPGILLVIGKLIAYMMNSFMEFDWVKLGDECMKALARGIIGALNIMIDAVSDVIGGLINVLAEAFGFDFRIDTEAIHMDKKPTYEAYKEDYSLRNKLEPWMYQDIGDLANGINNLGPLDNTGAGMNGSTGQQFGIDYEKMGEEMSKAMQGVDVKMDGKSVGAITTQYINANMAKLADSEKRGAR